MVITKILQLSKNIRQPKPAAYLSRKEDASYDL